MHRYIERIHLANVRRDIVYNLHVDLWRALSFPEFPAKIFGPILMMKLKTCHRHAWYPRVAARGKSLECWSVFCWKILENDQRRSVFPGKGPKALLQSICHPSFILFIACAQVSCPGGASDHQHAHGEKMRKHFSDKIDNGPNSAGN